MEGIGSPKGITELLYQPWITIAEFLTKSREFPCC